MRWSPRPAEEYVRTVKGGFDIGPGANPLLRANVAAWNIYWLTFPGLEDHTNLGSGSPEIISDPLAALVMETVLQPAGAARVGDLALHLPALQFVAQLRARDVDHLALVKAFGRDNWLIVMELRATLFAGARRSDLTLDLTSQENGTNAEESTNILPLAGSVSRLLH